MSFWEANRELADIVRLAESQILVNRQVTNQLTELEKKFRWMSDCSE